MARLIVVLFKHTTKRYTTIDHYLTSSSMSLSFEGLFLQY